MGGVAEAVHNLLGAGARARRQGAGQVAEVVEVDLGDADLGAGLLPGVLPDVRREWAALLAGEDVADLTWLREGVELVAQVGHERFGDGEDSPTDVGLGWADEVVAVAVELALANDRDLKSVEVDVAAPQSEDLASAEADEGGEERDASHPIRELLDEVVDLGHVGDRALVGGFDACALDGAGVLRDQAVLHRRREDRTEQPVALGCGAGAGSVGSSEAGVPAADLGCGDPGPAGAAEGRDDVQTQLHEVEVLDPWPERLAPLREAVRGPGVFLRGVHVDHG